MGKVSDYLSSLDGTQIDPIVMASTVLELHNEELEGANIKIAKLESDIQAKDVEVAERDNNIKELKIKNWDLVNRVPANEGGKEKSEDDDLADKDASEVTFDDFYEKED